MMHTDLERSAAFLLRNAGPVIRYRLRREILGDLDAASEASAACGNLRAAAFSPSADLCQAGRLYRQRYA